MKCNDFDKLQVLKRSFIAQLKPTSSEQEIFTFVYKIENKKVDWYNSQKQKREQISWDVFSKLFTGYILVFEPSDYVEEINFKRSRTAEIMQRAIEEILLFFLPLYLIVTILLHYNSPNYLGRIHLCNIVVHRMCDRWLIISA